MGVVAVVDEVLVRFGACLTLLLLLILNDLTLTVMVTGFVLVCILISFAQYNSTCTPQFVITKIETIETIYAQAILFVKECQGVKQEKSYSKIYREVRYPLQKLCPIISMSCLGSQ